MFAARNLPLDSSLKFSICCSSYIAVAPSPCCTIYGSPNAAAMIEPEFEPSPELQSVTIPEQSAPIPAAWIPPAATSPAALAYCTTARRVRMHRKRPCKICTWRNAVLPDPDSPVSDCHTPMNEMHESGRSDLNIALMADMHTKPNQKRMEVLSTQKLEAGCEDKQWLLKQFGKLVKSKNVRRKGVQKGHTTLNVKCTTRLDDIITLAVKLIEESGRDPDKETVFQRLQQEGRKSMLEGDASAHFERSRWLSHRCSSSQTCMMTSQFRSATRITASTTSKASNAHCAPDHEIHEEVSSCRANEGCHWQD